MADVQLAEGTILRGEKTGKQIEVGRYIDSGGQGEVYEISYDGVPKALKWYRDPRVVPKSLRGILQKNAAKGSPDRAFMWPIEVTDFYDVEVQTANGTIPAQTYGYVMDLIPQGFYSFEDFLLTERRFASFRVAVDACLEVCKVFRLLSSKGLCYQDVNAGNFFFRPETGDVVVCDCDNVADNGTSTGIIGTPGFMAPELVIDDWEYVNDVRGYRNEYQMTHRRRVQPNYRTDSFSMAVLLFEILTLTNPLAGRRALGPQDLERKVHLYGYDALFMFDPDSNENEAVEGVHTNAIAVWNALPSYLKDIFTRAFSQEAMRNANARLDVGEWLENLVRFRADIFTCPVCGSNVELFTDSAAATRCDVCGKQIKPPLVFEFEDGVRVPAVPGTRVYRIQIGTANIGEELDPVAVMEAWPGEPDNWTKWGVRNVSKHDFEASVQGSRTRTFAPGQVVPLGPDLSIRTQGKEIKVSLNNR